MADPGNGGPEPVREWGRRMRESRKNMQFSANKSPYLRNSDRYDKGYHKGLIRSRICAFNSYQGR